MYASPASPASPVSLCLGFSCFVVAALKAAAFHDFCLCIPLHNFCAHGLLHQFLGKRLISGWHHGDVLSRNRWLDLMWTSLQTPFGWTHVAVVFLRRFHAMGLPLHCKLQIISKQNIIKTLKRNGCSYAQWWCTIGWYQKNEEKNRQTVILRFDPPKVWGWSRRVFMETNSKQCELPLRCLLKCCLCCI